MSTVPQAEPEALAASYLVATRLAHDTAALERALREVDPGQFTTDAARLAFWINVYNARVKRAVRERGMSGNLLLHRGFFHQVGLDVGGHGVSLHVIEHGLLRGNRRAPYTPWRPLGARDPRRAWAIRAFDPRVHFALNCGAVSCPPIRAYAADRIDAQLARATRAYFETELVIEGGALRLPYLCTLYRADFPDLRAFAAAHVDPARAAWIRAHPDAPLRWSPYRWEIGETVTDEA